MENHFSPHCLQRGVTVDSGELFSKTLKDSSFLKGTLMQKWTIYVEYCSLRTFKRVKNMGCLMLNFGLLADTDCGESIFGDILSTNNSMKIR
jgi:hypothetical protein